MRSVLIAATTAVAFAALHPSPIAAQGADDRATCKNDKSPEKVIAACSRMLSDPQLPANEREWIFNHRAIANMDKEDWDRAIADFSEAIKLNPKDAVLLTNRSDAYRGRENYAKAVEDANLALKLDAKSVRAYHVRGRAHFSNSEYDTAIADFNQVIKLDPKFEAAYYYRGRSYFNKDEFKRAIPDLTQSIKMDPNYAETWFYRGLSHRRLGNATAALSDYKRVLELNPNHGPTLNSRGVINVNQGNYDEAIKDLTRAIEIEARADRYTNRGDAYRRKGELDLAIHDLTAALKINPKYSDAYYYRGLVLSRQGNQVAALADLRKAVELDPKDEYNRKALAKLEASMPAEAAAAPQGVISAPSEPAKTAIPVPVTPKVDGDGKRVALVIGNGKYQHSSQLANPRNDASDVAGALRNLGFEVIEGRDLDRAGMDNVIRQFSRKLDGAKLAMLFYAGHGLQVNGKNFLLPIDARIERAADLALDAFDVQRVIEQMEAEPRVNLIFLDACRDNPLSRSLARTMSTASRSAAVGAGLAPIQSAAGTLIAYATQPDNVALDGDGRNSPFTTALLKHMATPGLEVETMMKQVRLDVISATRNKQVPWGHSSLVGNVYLKTQ